MASSHKLGRAGLPPSQGSLLSACIVFGFTVAATVRETLREYFADGREELRDPLLGNNNGDWDRQAQAADGGRGGEQELREVGDGEGHHQAEERAADGRAVRRYCLSETAV